MRSPIQTLIDDYTDLHKSLMGNGQVSEANVITEHYRKILLLSCASYYETRIVEIIKKFVDKNISDDRISFFVASKAISRQYHTYFDWDSNNVNKFLSMFGADFKEKVSNEIKADKNLEDQAKSFMIIGSERNLMVHNSFLEYKLEKTFEEVVNLQEKANLFVDYLESKFS